jgi:membrane protease YdiL (CAAX protease family)
MYKISQPLFKKLFKSFNAETFKNAFKFALLAYGCMMCANIIDYELFGEQIENANQQAVKNLLLNSPFVACFMVIIIAPIIEELIFRYYVFKGLEKRNIFLAYAITGLTFAGIHLIASIGTPFILEDLRSLPLYIIGGLVFCYAYHKTGNMAVNIGAHMIYNAIATIFVFVFPNINAIEISNVVQTTHSLTITVEESAEMMVDVKSMEIYLYEEYRPYKNQEPIERIQTNTETVTFDSLSPNTQYIIIINYEMNSKEHGEVGLKQAYIDLYTLK